MESLEASWSRPNIRCETTRRPPTTVSQNRIVSTMYAVRTARDGVGSMSALHIVPRYYRETIASRFDMSR
jgi:hypothetical protein